MSQIRTYISLFSSAGIGCYGFKQEGFDCIATVELLSKRLEIQKYNQKCKLDSGYICGDMTKQETKDLIENEITFWKNNYGVKDLDVLIATPPCQGMSVANLKKAANEIERNSLVIESIEMTQRLLPKFFIYENVKAFLTTACIDSDEKVKSIQDAISQRLSGQYNILYKVLNFKEYGNPSSRTRTLVIGVRKDLKEVSPYDIYPHHQPTHTLRETIGHLPPLKTMGEISPDDIYHSFRPYPDYMECWVSDLKEGQSAFENTDPQKIPHRIVDGKIVYNAQKNGDKYTRQYWDKVAPCIHTRNDIMASQNTVHPSDNRVFSVRELMLMMSIPESFKWCQESLGYLNSLPLDDKKKYLKKEETNIRQNIGEAVPTIIFQQIAANINDFFDRKILSESEMKSLISEMELTNTDKMILFIAQHKDWGFEILSKIAETANAVKEETAAFYTRQDVCFTMVNELPDCKAQKTIRILEPSIGVGNFIPCLLKKYSDIPQVIIDVVDINNDSLRIFQALLELLNVPENFTINCIHDDFLLHNFPSMYDVVIGNPPYMKVSDKKLLKQYKTQVFNKETSNIFSFFIEKVLSLGSWVSLVVPKSLINAPEFKKTRDLINSKHISTLIDFGEKGFKGVKIETISFFCCTLEIPSQTKVISYITNDVITKDQSYITDPNYPYWLIYRNSSFDEMAGRLVFNVFTSFRDRAITKQKTKPSGKIRVLKSRNIGNNCIVNIPDYDCYIDDYKEFEVSKYLGKSNSVLVPNLSYSPRACFLPDNCIADGSVAILTAKTDVTITSEDLAVYATDEFREFYMVARNRGSRSLNIDNSSVFFFGKLK